MNITAAKLALVMAVTINGVAIAVDYGIGDTVVVVNEQTTIQAGNNELGHVTRGTRFTVAQRNGKWLLGEFTVAGHSVLGWVDSRSVRSATQTSANGITIPFTWQNLLLARAKLDPSFNLLDLSDQYFKAVRNAEWRRYGDDEFQRQSRIEAGRRLINQHLEDLDVSRDFLVRTELTIGEFDFSQGCFPIVESSPNQYWYASSPFYAEALPHQMTVYLRESSLIGGLPMDANLAASFLASRKSSYGDINRRVFANMRLRMVGVRPDGDLEADLRKIEFYGDEKRTKLLFATPEPPTDIEP